MRLQQDLLAGVHRAEPFNILLIHADRGIIHQVSQVSKYTVPNRARTVPTGIIPTDYTVQNRPSSYNGPVPEPELYWTCTVPDIYTVLDPY